MPYTGPQSAALTVPIIEQATQLTKQKKNSLISSLNSSLVIFNVHRDKETRESLQAERTQEC